jgi:hypothetical protein
MSSSKRRDSTQIIDDFPIRGSSDGPAAACSSDYNYKPHRSYAANVERGGQNYELCPPPDHVVDYEGKKSKMDKCEF